MPLDGHPGQLPLQGAYVEAESSYQTTVHPWLQQNLHKGTHASSELVWGSRVHDWRFRSNHISEV